jgi:hypothetical protein
MIRVPVGATMVLALLASGHVHAAVFQCPAGDVACLIAAINTANGNGEEDTIELAAGTYTLTAVDNETDGPNGTPSITSQINLNSSDTGGAGKGGLSGLCRHPLPHRVRGRTRPGTQDRRANGGDVPPACEEVAADRPPHASPVGGGLRRVSSVWLPPQPTTGEESMPPDATSTSIVDKR